VVKARSLSEGERGQAQAQVRRLPFPDQVGIAGVGARGYEVEDWAVLALAFPVPSPCPLAFLPCPCRRDPRTPNEAQGSIFDLGYPQVGKVVAVRLRRRLALDGCKQWPGKEFL
jgi:hypothetical protein